MGIRGAVRTLFESGGYQVICAETCRDAEREFDSYIPDVVILDLGLPDMDGMEFIKYVRSRQTTPIIVLSARSDERDKVGALELGANDYITKPFGTAELLARVRAAIRTMNNLVIGSGQSFSLNGMEIDFDRRTVTVNENDIKLTQNEYNILALLARNSGRLLTYTEIINTIWGKADFNAVKKLQVNMANLRKKLGTKPGDHRFIINELGVGYRIQDPVN